MHTTFAIMYKIVVSVALQIQYTAVHTTTSLHDIVDLKTNNSKKTMRSLLELLATKLLATCCLAYGSLYAAGNLE